MERRSHGVACISRSGSDIANDMNTAVVRTAAAVVRTVAAVVAALVLVVVEAEARASGEMLPVVGETEIPRSWEACSAHRWEFPEGMVLNPEEGRMAGKVRK